jgi:hypothetical protein
MGWRSEAIERQMAHGVSDSIRRHYNYAQHLPERLIMMQAWADYLDGLLGARQAVCSSPPATCIGLTGRATAHGLDVGGSSRLRAAADDLSLPHR